MSVLWQFSIDIADNADWEWDRYVACWLAYDLCGEPEPPWDLETGVAEEASALLDDLWWRECPNRQDAMPFLDRVAVALKRLQRQVGSLGSILDEELEYTV